VGERAKIAIMVGVTGVAAYVGHETSGLIGAQIAAVVLHWAPLFAQRKDNLATVTEGAAERSGWTVLISSPGLRQTIGTPCSSRRC
jgi:hypothetical protein